MNILLTIMLLILPLFSMQKNIHYIGLNTGLWVSLFFWGRLHFTLSFLVFICAFFDFFLTSGRTGERRKPSYAKHPFKPSYYFFISSMVIFCALGKTTSLYGSYLHLEDALLTHSTITGFLGSLSGPILFGVLSDKKGPFPAVVILLLTAALSIGITARSSLYPELFLIGHGLYWMSVSGTFVLLPLYTLHLLGRSRLYQCAPRIIFLLSIIWIFVCRSAESSAKEDSASLLILCLYLVLSAALSSFLSWKSRLILVS